MHREQNKLLAEFHETEEYLNKNIYNFRAVFGATCVGLIPCALPLVILDSEIEKVLACLLVLSVAIFVIPKFIYAQIKQDNLALRGKLSLMGYSVTEGENFNIIEQKTDVESDFIVNFERILFKYIETYYGQTQQQAQKSFLISLTVSILAFIILAGGLIVSYYQKNDNVSYVVTSTGIFTEIISAVFFYIYNKSIVKMNDYHHKLVFTQNIALASKISGQMNETDRSETQKAIIAELIKDFNIHINPNNLDTQNRHK